MLAQAITAFGSPSSCRHIHGRARDGFDESAELGRTGIRDEALLAGMDPGTDPDALDALKRPGPRQEPLPSPDGPGGN
jgi:hypothetical protein